MRKLVVLLAGLALVAVAQPSDASHSLDNVVANVNGGVDIGDPDAGHGPCTTSAGETGRIVKFTDVVITGEFVAGETNLASFLGAVNVGDLEVCLVVDEQVGPFPILTHGELGATTFQSPDPGKNALVVPAEDVCVYGDLLGGQFSGTGAVFAEAVVQATYTVNAPSNGTCPEDPTLRGAELASSADSVDLIADTLTVPVGEATGGEIPNQVSSQVHTAHL